MVSLESTIADERDDERIAQNCAAVTRAAVANSEAFQHSAVAITKVNAATVVFTVNDADRASVSRPKREEPAAEVQILVAGSHVRPVGDDDRVAGDARIDARLNCQFRPVGR